MPRPGTSVRTIPAVRRRSPWRNRGRSPEASRSQARSPRRTLICGQQEGRTPGPIAPAEARSGPRLRERISPGRLSSGSETVGVESWISAFAVKPVRCVSGIGSPAPRYTSATWSRMLWGSVGKASSSFSWIAARTAFTRPTPTSVATSYSPVRFAIVASYACPMPPNTTANRFACGASLAAEPDRRVRQSRRNPA